MFSFFENGITGATPNNLIDFQKLVKIIKNNPERILIEHIRTLRKCGNTEYKLLKERLPYITPNCRVKYRSLKKDENFKENFVGHSGFIYFDTDGVSNVETYKEYFINRYGHQVCMVCKSSSCGGLSILFRLEDNISIKSKEQFFGIWDHIRTTILKDEKIDPQCKDFGRAMFISYDPDVYVNYENEIKVEINDVNIIEKRVNHPNSRIIPNNKVIYPFSENKKENYLPRIIRIDIVLKKLITKTRVIVDNSIVDFKPIDYATVFVPNVIADETKHKIYTRIINQLVYLNPDIEKEYIFSFLWFINNTRAKPKMEKRELIRFFESLYNKILSTGIILPKTTIKKIHFEEECQLKGKEKNKIANKLNGYYRRHKNIQKIREAVQELRSLGMKVTKVEVARMTGLSPKTVRTRINDEPIDMDLVVSNFNDPSVLLQNRSPEPLGIELRRGFARIDTFTSPEDFIHPECPKWVLEYNFLNN